MSQPGIVESRTFNLRVDHIDTDQIIPAQFLTTTEREGLGRFCFYGWRFDDDGAERERHPFRDFEPNRQQVLVAGSNFGCGSSREHAPWALEDWGIKAMIAPSFADIFYNNCINIGLLPVVLTEAEVGVLTELAEDPTNTVTVDLENQLVIAAGFEASFEIDPFAKHRLVNGLDNVALTLQHAAEITTFEMSRPDFKPALS